MAGLDNSYACGGLPLPLEPFGPSRGKPTTGVKRGPCAAIAGWWRPICSNDSASVAFAIDSVVGDTISGSRSGVNGSLCSSAGFRSLRESSGGPAITKNHRYESSFDALNDQRIAEAVRRGDRTCTLPQQAYGSQPIEWAPRSSKPEVWVWISWRDAPASRIPAVAAGWNDRVVIVEWEAAGGRKSVVVWRGAVSHRKDGSASVPVREPPR